jgi:hypothetical protein
LVISITDEINNACVGADEIFFRQGAHHCTHVRIGRCALHERINLDQTEAVLTPAKYGNSSKIMPDRFETDPAVDQQLLAQVLMGDRGAERT